MLLFISTKGILLVVALLLVMDLTIFQTVFVLYAIYSIEFSSHLFHENKQLKAIYVIHCF
jgi:hypothetical protein